MILYNQLSLSTFQKICFYLVTFSASLLLGWLFYDNFFVSIIFFSLLQPLQTVYKKFLIEKRKNVLLVQFKDLLYSISSLISAGRSVGQALEESVDFLKGTYEDTDYIICELKYMTKRMNESRESDIAVLEDFAERTGFEDIKDFAETCRICKETGSNMAKAIAKTSDIISDKISLEKELKTVVSQKKFEGRIVASSPFFMVLGIKILSPAYLAPLTETSEGHLITTLALTLIIYGWIIIERMNKIDF